MKLNHHASVSCITWLHYIATHHQFLPHGGGWCKYIISYTSPHTRAYMHAVGYSIYKIVGATGAKFVVKPTTTPNCRHIIF